MIAALHFPKPIPTFYKFVISEVKIMFPIQCCHLPLLMTLIICSVINVSVACNPMKHFDTLEYGNPPQWYIAGTTDACPSYGSSPRYLVPVSEDSTQGTCVEQLPTPKIKENPDLKDQEVREFARRIPVNNCPEGRAWSNRLRRCIKKGRQLSF